MNGDPTMLKVRLSARQNPDFPRRDDLPKPVIGTDGKAITYLTHQKSGRPC